MGLEWVKLGVRTFWRQPIALAALFFLCMAGMSLISALPIVGTIVALTLLPTFSLIMMVAAAEVWSNRVPTPVLIWHILRQGKERLAALATLGVCYAVGFGLVMFLSSLVDGGEFARVYLGLAPLSQELAQSASFQAAMWTACLLYLPLSFLFGTPRRWCTGTTCRRSKPCFSASWPAPAISGLFSCLAWGG